MIVLAGTKLQLLSQTRDRLRRDLRADGDGGANPWVLTEKLTKGTRKESIQQVQNVLKIWLEKDAPKTFKSTVVITSLKNRESLDEIVHLIDGLKSRFDLNNFPVLIIDDEGDQAGLNLKWRDDEESPVYAAINRMRNSLARHSYVMYTATPQGPLLIGIQDALSPKFVTLLKSGEDYLGGRDLFEANDDFVKYIPNHELSTYWLSTLLKIVQIQNHFRCSSILHQASNFMLHILAGLMTFLIHGKQFFEIQVNKLTRMRKVDSLNWPNLN